MSFTVVIVGYNFALANQREARALVGRTSDVRRQIQRVLSEVMEAEAGARGFALTNREVFLEPVATVAAQLPADVRQLELLAEGTSLIPDRSLQELVEARMVMLRELVATARLPGVTISQLDPLVDEGKSRMDQLRGELALMDERAERLRAGRLDALAAADRTLKFVIPVAFVLGTAGGLGAMVLFTRGIVAAIGELEQNADRLAAGKPLRHLRSRRDEIGGLDRRLQLAAGLLQRRNRELNAANEQSQKSLSLLQATLDATTDGIAAVDRDGQLVLRNDRFVEMWDLPEDVAGIADQSELFGAILARIREPDAVLDALRPALEVPDATGCLYIELRSGEVFEVRYHPQKLGDEIVGRVWGVRDVTVTHRYHEELERARDDAEASREAAERANVAKSEFLSRMSHELRTPLNAILGFSQLLEMDARDAAQRESVTQVLKAGRHLLGLIDEVLDISRIEAGRLSLSIEPVAVAETVTEVIDLIGPMATDRGVTVEAADVLTSPLHVLADRQRLKQVLLNIMSNAVKYNRDGGSIRVTTARPTPATVRIEVTDTGPGIAEENLPKLFAPFERIGAEQTDIQGTGLGLALSKVLAAAMGGTLGVRSTRGVGSTFWVELTEAPPEVVALDQPPARRGEAYAGPVPAGPGDGERPKVLYIEDNVSNLRLIERLMDQRPGVELLTAMQGSIGLELAQTHRPRLVLLDLHLPDMTGDQVLATLRSQPATREIPVVIVSADATPGHVRRLLDAGAQGYLTKPLELGPLLEILDHHLRREAQTP
ncbi:MAG: ATP-binding protein [Actinomycetota bacterium]